MRMTRSAIYAARIRELRAVNRARDALESRVEKALLAEFRILSGALENLPVSIRNHERRLKDLLSSSLSQGSMIGIAIARHGFLEKFALKEKKADTQEELRARAAEWALERAARRARSLSEQTKRVLGYVVADYESRPSGISGARTLAAELRERVQTMSKSRSRTIARTESGAAIMYGRHESTEQVAGEYGVTVRKTWVATEDERTRESHATADGQTVNLEDDFNVGGESLAYPSDPAGAAGEVINCRCSVSYEPVESVQRDAGPESFSSQPPPELGLGGEIGAVELPESYRPELLQGISGAERAAVLSYTGSRSSGMRQAASDWFAAAPAGNRLVDLAEPAQAPRPGDVELARVLDRLTKDRGRLSTVRYATRGLRLDPAVISRLALGSSVYDPSFSSWTVDPAVATWYAMKGRSGIPSVITAKSIRGLAVSELSTSSWEAELIVGAGAWVVQRISKTPLGLTLIELG